MSTLINIGVFLTEDKVGAFKDKFIDLESANVFQGDTYYSLKKEVLAELEYPENHNLTFSFSSKHSVALVETDFKVCTIFIEELRRTLDSLIGYGRLFVTVDSCINLVEDFEYVDPNDPEMVNDRLAVDKLMRERYE